MKTSTALSFELICLMEWLLNNSERKIIKLVNEALKNGFSTELEKMNEEKYLQIAKDLPKILLNFIFLLEDALIEGLDQGQEENATTEKLLPTIKSIDQNKIDPEIVWISIQQTKSSIGQINNKNDAKQILFKKLLKNWNPKQNEPLN